MCDRRISFSVYLLFGLKGLCLGACGGHKGVGAFSYERGTPALVVVAEQPKTRTPVVHLTTLRLGPLCQASTV